MHRSLPIVLVVLISFSSVHARNEPWALRDYACRRSIEVDHTDSTTGLEGGTGYASFETFGHVRADGADVSVRAGRKEIPHKVLAVSPTGRVTVAFKTLKARPHLAVYFGNPDAKPDASDWQPNRGLYAASAEWKKGLPGQWAAVEKLYRSFFPTGQGASAVERIHVGYNPFGPSHHYAQWFEGTMRAAKDGEYTFVLAVGRRGFFAIDGKPIARVNANRPPRRIHPGLHHKVELEAGLHRVQAVHFTEGGHPACTLLWRPPGAKKFEIVPPEVFTTPTPVTMGLLEKKDRKTAADFTWENEALVFYNSDYERVPVADRYYDRFAVRTAFKARTPPGTASGSTFAWTFGDGQTSTQHMPTHFYLHPGRYRVTLTVTDPDGNTDTTEADIQAATPWHRQAEMYLDDRKAMAPVVARYDLAKLDDTALENLMLYYYRTEAWEDVKKAAGVLLLSDRKLPDEVRFHAAGMSAEVVCYKLEDYDGAVRFLMTSAERIDNKPLAAQLKLTAGDIRLKKQYDNEAGRRLYAEVLENHPDDRTLKRAALIGLGHVGFFTGRGDMARENYRKAAAIEVVQRDAAKAQLARSNYARTVEDYIRRNEWVFALKTLEKWEWEFPMDRFDGHLALLWGRYYAERGEVHIAAYLLSSLQKTNPRSTFADQCLVLAAECYEKFDKPEKAREMREILRQEYPESPLVGE